MDSSFLQNHLTDMANQLGCRLDQYDCQTPGMMYVEFGYVEGPTLEKIDSPLIPSIESRYMVNMHELGHYAHGHTQGRPPMQNETWYFANGVLKSEAEAWEWALDNSILEEYTKETQNYMWEKCMGSYYRGSRIDGYTRKDNRLGNGNRHHVAFQWDKPTEFFWSVKERMENGNSIKRSTKTVRIRDLQSS